MWNGSCGDHFSMDKNKQARAFAFIRQADTAHQNDTSSTESSATTKGRIIFSQCPRQLFLLALTTHAERLQALANQHAQQGAGPSTCG